MLNSISVKEIIDIKLGDEFKKFNNKFKSSDELLNQITIVADSKCKIFGDDVDIEFKDIVDDIKEFSQDIFECPVNVFSTDYMSDDKRMYVIPDYQKPMTVITPASLVGDDSMIKDETLYSFDKDVE